MLILIQHNLVTLALALLIGVSTGWWMFAGRRGAAISPDSSREDPPES